MLRTLTAQDKDLLRAFFASLGHQNPEHIQHIIDTLGTTSIVTVNQHEDKITSLVVTTLIKNEYYLGDVVITNIDLEEIRALLRYTIEVLRDDERGLCILYDNSPYSEQMNEILLKAGFKCNYLNYTYDNKSSKIEPIHSEIVINDKSDAVRRYIFENYERVMRSNDLYQGYNTISKMQESDIRFDNSNIVIAKRQNENLGVARFNLITDEIYISMLYASDKSIYIDLINMIKNLTNRNLSVGVLPVRKELMEILHELGFKKSHSEYVLKF